VKPAPPDWPRLSAALFYDDPRAAIDWLCKAFGFSVRILVDGPDGTVAHSELAYGDTLMMVAGCGPAYACETDRWRERLASPAMAGGRVTANLTMYVDDVDAHCAQAKANDAEVLTEPRTVDYGDEYWSDRNYCCLDCEGHVWWFLQRLSTKGVKA